MIRIWHVSNDDKFFDLRRSLTFALGSDWDLSEGPIPMKNDDYDQDTILAQLSRRLEKLNGYNAVAEIDTDDLEKAFYITQNITASWSLSPKPCVRILGDLSVIKDKVYGYKSSSVGDVFERNGKRFVVANFGFVEL